MSPFEIGAALRRLHPAGHVLGHADRLLARAGGDRVHGLLHAAVGARYGDAERLRGDVVDHPAVDPAVHPEGRRDRPLAGRPRPLLGAACLDEPHPGRPRHRQRLRLRPVRRDGGLEPGDLLGDRLGRHPGDAQARLSRRLRGRPDRRRRHARHPAAALDHHDPLCRRLGAVARPAVPGRHRPGAAAGHCSSPRYAAWRYAYEARHAAGRLGAARQRALHARPEVRRAAARAAVRAPADRRDDRAVRRLRHAVGDGGPRRHPRPDPDRADLQHLAAQAARADHGQHDPRIDHADADHRHVAVLLLRDELPAHQPVGGDLDRGAAPVALGAAGWRS